MQLSLADLSLKRHEHANVASKRAVSLCVLFRTFEEYVLQHKDRAATSPLTSTAADEAEQSADTPAEVCSAGQRA